MGSLGSDVDVSYITYRNVYTWSSNQMYMVSYHVQTQFKDTTDLEQ